MLSILRLQICLLKVKNHITKHSKVIIDFHLLIDELKDLRKKKWINKKKCKKEEIKDILIDMQILQPPPTPPPPSNHRPAMALIVWACCGLGWFPKYGTSCWAVVVVVLLSTINQFGSVLAVANIKFTNIIIIKIFTYVFHGQLKIIFEHINRTYKAKRLKSPLLQQRWC